MAFPGNNFTTPDAAADALLSNLEAIAGVSIGSKLNMDAVVLYTLANLFDPTASNRYFATLGAAVTSTSVTFTTNAISVTALATPSALTATQFTGFASTVSGAALMGFGTTNDVSLMNRAGTVVIGVGPNTTAVSLAGATTIAAGGLIVTAGGVAVTAGAITTADPANGVGYVTGAGGTVTQITSKATTVVLSKPVGTIVLVNSALAADTTVAFTWTNTVIGANDVIHILHDSVGTLGAYTFAVTPAAGSATVSVHNCTPGSLSEAIVLRFAVIKGAVA